MIESPVSADSLHGPLDWRDSAWSANVWLLFLGFPLVSLLVTEEGTRIKVVVTALIVVFAVVHVLGYRANALRAHSNRDDLDRLPLLDLLNPWPYFLGLVAIQLVSVALANLGLLGLMPFLVVFALFNFSWRAAAIVGFVCLVTSLALPAFAGQLNDFWFFPILIVGAGAGAAFARIGEESLADRAAMQTGLAVSDERNRVARDVHDVLGHSLTAVILKTQVCARLVDTVEGGPEGDQVALDRMKAELAELESVARRAMAEIRSTVGGLRVAKLADEVAAARAVLADASVTLTVQGNADTVPAEHEPLLAWVVRESVTNIVRHARAGACTIEIPGSAKGAGTLIRITDDGVGLGPNGNGTGSAGNNPASEGNGIRGMRERVAAVGAELVLGPGPEGKGTKIEVRV